MIQHVLWCKSLTYECYFNASMNGSHFPQNYINVISYARWRQQWGFCYFSLAPHHQPIFHFQNVLPLLPLSGLQADFPCWQRRLLAMCTLCAHDGTGGDCAHRPPCGMCDTTHTLPSSNSSVPELAVLSFNCIVILIPFSLCKVILKDLDGWNHSNLREVLRWRTQALGVGLTSISDKNKNGMVPMTEADNLAIACHLCSPLRYYYTPHGTCYTKTIPYLIVVWLYENVYFCVS